MTSRTRPPLRAALLAAALAACCLPGRPAHAVLGATRSEVQGKYGAPRALATSAYYQDEYRFNGMRLQVRYDPRTQRVVWLSLFLSKKQYDGLIKDPQEAKLHELAGRYGVEPQSFHQATPWMRYDTFPSYARWVYLRPREVEVELILDETAHSLLK